MEVKLAANLRQLVGAKSVDVDATPGETVGSVLRKLVERYPSLRPELFTESGELEPYVGVFVRGVDVRRREGLDTRLEEGDDLSIIPPIAGGSYAPDTRESAATLP
uniref:MoaD/ThiS family protein n=1 Tax=Thermorudis sp. TaxID=1969470 RepID=A0A7C3ASM0_9BACT